MALIDPKAVKRIEIPHEPGSWVEIRPITARMFANVQRDGKGESYSEITLRLLNGCIAAWSYDAAVSPENIDNLDPVTMNFLDEQMNLTSGSLSAEEKKDNISPPSPPSSTEDDSQPSSGI